MKKEMPEKVDRRSPMPVYQQIAADITARITQEEWCIGDKIPSENELTEEYSASRVTVRQALSKLEQEGLIDKQRGRGAFVKAYPVQMSQDLFLPQIGNPNIPKAPCGDIRISVVTDASQHITNHLGVPQGTPLVYLQRYFYKGDRIIGFNQAWFPMDRVPDMEKQPLFNNSISDTLQQRYHIRFGSVENYIEALMMGAEMSHILDAPSSSPALKINSIYRDDQGEIVEYSLTIWNGKDTRFHVVLSNK